MDHHSCPGCKDQGILVGGKIAMKTIITSIIFALLVVLAIVGVFALYIIAAIYQDESDNNSNL